MVYNNLTYVDDFIKKLHKYWRYLQCKYKMNTELAICNSDNAVMYGMKSLTHEGPYSRDDIINKLVSYGSACRRSIAITLYQYNTIETDDSIWNIDFVVMIEEANLFLLMLENIDQLDKLYEYYKLSLRHEMGHVIDFTTGLLLPESDYIIFEEKMHSDLSQIYELKNNPDIILNDFIQQYYSIDVERRANENVGLTYKDHIRSDKIFYDHEFSIKIKE